MNILNPKLRMMVRPLEGAKVAAAMDQKGRVIVVVSDKVALPSRLLYFLWGLYKFASFNIQRRARSNS